MKQQFGVFVIIFIFLVSSCKKESEEDSFDVSEGNFFNELDTLSIPESFEQNQLYEVFTATWCGWCPNVDYSAEQKVKDNPSRIFAVMIHEDEIDGDPNDTLYDFFNVSGFPDQSVNYGSRYASSSLDNTSKVGIALGFEEIGSDSFHVRIIVGFKENISQELKLVVYLSEDGIIAPQVNQFNDDSTSVFYEAGWTIDGFQHNNVLRKSITSSLLGETIQSSETLAGNKLVRTYSFSIDSKWNKEKLKVTAFACDGYLGEKPGVAKIFNVNQTRLGQIKIWN